MLVYLWKSSENLAAIFYSAVLSIDINSLRLGKSYYINLIKKNADDCLGLVLCIILTESLC